MPVASGSSSSNSTGRISTHRALADAEDAPAIAVDGARDGGADRGIEPGAIAAAGQHTKFFF